MPWLLSFRNKKVAQTQQYCITGSPSDEMDILVLRPTQGYGYLFPYSPEINWLVPLFSDIGLVSLKIWPLFPCSPEIIHLVPVFTKTLWGWGGGSQFCDFC